MVLHALHGRQLPSHKRAGGCDHVIGPIRNADGVEFVVVHDVKRGG